MSIFYMSDNHSFLRLDHKSIDDAMDAVEQATDIDGGYGLVGCKGEHGNETFQWRPGEPWRKKVREILSTGPKETDRRKGPKDRRQRHD